MAAEARLELAMTGVKDQYVYQFHHSAIWRGIGESNSYRMIDSHT